MRKVYEGSVKNVWKAEGSHTAIFEYTDAYSVFDYGKMPDQIPHKGAALAVMAASIFEQLSSPQKWQEFSRSPVALELRKGVAEIAEALKKNGKSLRSVDQGSFIADFNDVAERLQSRGLKTHYQGVMDEASFASAKQGAGLQLMKMSDLKDATRYMAVKEVQVQPPEVKTVLGREVVDYSGYRKLTSDRLVPFEVIFRFSCPEGSSLLKQLKKNPDYLSSLAVPDSVQREGLKSGQKLAFPILELTTKLEPEDRRISISEGIAMSGISPAQMQEVFFLTAWVGGWLKWQFGDMGLELADGKLEWAQAANGEFFLVDAIGPDELRVLKDGAQISKEWFRRRYQRLPWYESVTAAKNEAKTQGAADFKSFLKEQPPALDPEDVRLGSQMYQSFSNRISGRDLFKAPEIGEIVEGLLKREAE